MSSFHLHFWKTFYLGKASDLTGFFSFITLKLSLHCLLVWTVYEKADVITFLPLFVIVLFFSVCSQDFLFIFDSQQFDYYGLGVFSYVFILIGVLQTSWICRLLSFINFGKVLPIIFKHIFCTFISLFPLWVQLYMFDICPTCLRCAVLFRFVFPYFSFFVL